MTEVEALKIYRLRPTTSEEVPSPDAPEGMRAAWWREHRMGLSRPALADRLGINFQRIVRYEQMIVVPQLYRLACAAISADAENFDWTSHHIKLPSVNVNLYETGEEP